VSDGAPPGAPLSWPGVSSCPLVIGFLSSYRSLQCHKSARTLPIVGSCKDQLEHSCVGGDSVTTYSMLQAFVAEASTSYSYDSLSGLTGRCCHTKNHGHSFGSTHSKRCGLLPAVRPWLCRLELLLDRSRFMTSLSLQAKNAQAVVGH